MQEIILFGVTGAALVTLLVQAAKVLGLKRKYYKVSALASGFLVAGLWVGYKLYPEIGPYIEVLVIGLGLGIGGTGLYNQLEGEKKSDA